MTSPSEKCPHCGLIHETTCHLIKAIEYQPDGVTVKRVEFHGPQPIITPFDPGRMLVGGVDEP